MKCLKQRMNKMKKEEIGPWRKKKWRGNKQRKTRGRERIFKRENKWQLVTIEQACIHAGWMDTLTLLALRTVKYDRMWCDMTVGYHL